MLKIAGGFIFRETTLAPMDTHRIPEKSGGSFSVSEGEKFTVINPEGAQIADLVAFNRHDPMEYFSQSYTRSMNSRLRISTGDILYTVRGNPMLTITHDDCGIHDILYCPCDAQLLECFHDPEPGGCRENLEIVLEPKGIDMEMPDTLNIFQKSTVADQTYIDIRPSPAEVDDRVTFEAEMDLIVGVTSCSGSGPANGNNLTPIDVEIPDSESIFIDTVQDQG